MKKKKTAVRAVILYLVLTTGIYMFITSYSNSHNRLTLEKTEPAGITLNGSTAKMQILEESFSINVEALMPESKLYSFVYLFVPDEVRILTFLVAVDNKL